VSKLRLDDLGRIMAARAARQEPPPPPPPVPGYIEDIKPHRHSRTEVTRDHLAARRAAYEAMDRVSLELEIAALSENTGVVRIDLAAHYANDPDARARNTDWQRRAERALTGMNSELTLAKAVLRQKDETAQETKRAVRSLQEERDREFSRQFMAQAKRFLATEVYMTLINETQHAVDENPPPQS
jgi:hypothetical protein